MTEPGRGCRGFTCPICPTGWRGAQTEAPGLQSQPATSFLFFLSGRDTVHTLWEVRLPLGFPHQKDQPSALLKL